MRDFGSRLRSAVSAQRVPEALPQTIRQGIHSYQRRKRQIRIWLATALVALVAGAYWLGSVPAQEAYIAQISAKLSPTMKLGLGDHVHCAVFCKYPPTPPPLAEVAKELRPPWSGLLPIMTSAVPSGYQIMSAHRCGYRGRTFVHLVFRRGSSLLSLILTKKKPGETLPDSAIETSTAGYSLAGFDAGAYLAFVASQEPNSSNEKIALSVAPRIRQFIASAVG